MSLVCRKEERSESDHDDDDDNDGDEEMVDAEAACSDKVSTRSDADSNDDDDNDEEKESVKFPSFVVIISQERKLRLIGIASLLLPHTSVAVVTGQIFWSCVYICIYLSVLFMLCNNIGDGSDLMCYCT